MELARGGREFAGRRSFSMSMIRQCAYSSVFYCAVLFSSCDSLLHPANRVKDFNRSYFFRRMSCNQIMPFHRSLPRDIPAGRSSFKRYLTAVLKPIGLSSFAEKIRLAYREGETDGILSIDLATRKSLLENPKKLISASLEALGAENKGQVAGVRSNSTISLP